MKLIELLGETPKKDYYGKSVVDANYQDVDIDSWNEHYYDINIQAGEKAAMYLQKNCSPWLNQTRNGKLVVFRGDDHGDVVEVMIKKHVRRNREPLDTDIDIHKVIVKLIKALGLIANRNNSIFVTSEKFTASNYGEVYVTIPVGNFNYTWNPKIDDFHSETESRNWEILGIKGKTKQQQFKIMTDTNNRVGKKLSYYQGDNGTLAKAIKSGKEIMLHSSEILLIDKIMYKRYILPILNGQVPDKDE